MKPIAAVVILYHPEPSTVENIKTYSPFVDVVYAIDNSETPSPAIVKGLAAIPNCRYFGHRENQGIARRLNEACNMARSESYEWLLTMDQDSSFEEGVFETYLNRVRNFEKNNIAVFGVNFMPEFWPANPEPKQVESTITSGSLVNLDIQKRVGDYKEALFIDFVDAEYCYRAVGLDYRIVSFMDIVLTHRIGYIQMGRSLKTLKLTPRLLHSPIRVYYIVRNAFYLLKYFSNLSPVARKEIWKTMSLLKNNIIYHRERKKVLFYALKGYMDFKRNRMGKLST